MAIFVAILRNGIKLNSEYETAGQWSGNIGKQTWSHKKPSPPADTRSYTFSYDGLSRLTAASYSGLTGESFGLPLVSYDKNGNITALQRNGKMGGPHGLMDNLTYTYSGNRLSAVNDAISGEYEVDFVKRGGGTYGYHANGALNSDENEKISSITYNTFLNLPEQVNLNDGRWIKYTYDGAGTLLKTEYSNGEYWEYVEGVVFKNGQPYQMAIPEGRAVYESSQWKLEYDIKDHLGNTRVSFREGVGGAELKAKTDFDPWGVRLNGTGTVNSFQNRWEMQGKEKESTFNLNMVNFGARYYNATLGRFLSIDPRATEREWLTPYNYVQNNPIMRIDPDGAFDDYAMRDDGRVVLVQKTEDKFDRLTASNGNEIKINKATASSGSIISQLSKEDSGGFSMGTTTNATDARNLYNFMDANTTRGTEFSLAGSMENGRVNYSVSTSHEIGSTSFDKIGIKPTNLIFHIHNHDGDLNNSTATYPSNADKTKVDGVLREVVKTSRFLPRFFLSLENGAMREVYQKGKKTETTNLNIRTANLKNIKRYDYYSKNRKN
ncbi:putative cell wall-associated protein precursor [Leadbetterella byssophila DSM 17132]|uniref:Cell wall-associated protein n=1 Tax=Leadbetterella byssophila (strain DSM 17132 / JCM 16389 / KACC 11308 / NBRC 106382 / 4M15) TaxID=649349 RepID=E4RWK7_LEAB4|nr:JAB-like toxin 1 domain-containing protein [Leadbetterella byssophila]ADQ18947.1 putative cell wall-associated protein precursor [Leadbetterella byssophila DSM 17132]